MFVHANRLHRPRHQVFSAKLHANPKLYRTALSYWWGPHCRHQVSSSIIMEELHSDRHIIAIGRFHTKNVVHLESSASVEDRVLPHLCFLFFFSANYEISIFLRLLRSISLSLSLVHLVRTDHLPRTRFQIFRRG